MLEYALPDKLTEEEKMVIRNNVSVLLSSLHAQHEKEQDLTKVNRVEVIDHTKPVEQGGGRAYVFWEDKAKVEISIQDDGRTLKVFISKP